MLRGETSSMAATNCPWWKTCTADGGSGWRPNGTPCGFAVIAWVNLSSSITSSFVVPTAEPTAPVVMPRSASDEYGLVTLKIAHLGRQMRDAKEIFSALKDNVDQIMANLQDGLMLFTGDSRVVLVSASVERFRLW